MKTLSIATAVFTCLVATSSMANQDDKHEHGTTGAPQGSAMNENHQRANTADLDKDGKTINQKMKTEVQDDWREDAKERREADASRPEQR